MSGVEQRRSRTTEAQRNEDRERTAARLLRSSAEKFYDPDVDIAWDAPWVEGKAWLPEERISLYGTKLWDQLTPEQRIELGKHELVSLLSFGIWAEAVLSGILLRVVGHGPATSAHSLYALTEIADEARHSTMFARLIEKTGVPAYRQPAVSRLLERVVQLMPIGPATYGGTLLIEEVLDRGQRQAMADPGVQPHVRQLMRIHVLEEARHISYARAEMRRGLEKRNALRRAPHRAALAGFAVVVYPLMITPRVYRSVGISPARGFAAAMRSPQYRINMTFMSEPMLRYFAEVGMYDGAVTKFLWKLTRSVPAELAAK
ncbi:AurF N-oxygenase family protein [Aldersonia kunmingensis]|uniref:AurF N-oxygenase family protein n=1 Tax=Aldersonia kunmingensis TaxID=408066 RepID=UPI0008360259|nr:diiron oxygenase [Aldersonia kunmingensis]